MHLWPSDIAPQNRCHVAGFQYGRQWLQGGVFYGNAFQSGGVSTRESNNRLLSHIVHRICECARGPRFIGGDFNHFIDELPEVQKLLQQGWQEVQHLAAAKFGQPIQPTIQQKHTKDLLFLSPELTPFVKQVCVESDWAANHSIVFVVVLDVAASPPCVPIWKQPRPVDWQAYTGSMNSEENPHVGHPYAPTEPELSRPSTRAEERYRSIWSSFERQKVSEAKNLGFNLHGSQTGRGATLERTWITETFVPLRPSRPGSFTPEYHGNSMLHTRCKPWRTCTMTDMKSPPNGWRER